MAMNIKNQRVHDLAREAATLTGATQTSALESALESYLDGLKDHDSQQGERLSRARELVAQIQGSLTDEDRAAMRRHLEEMYDDEGLPA